MNELYNPCVYVIHAAETEYYKIGFSSKLNNRIKTFQVSFPFLKIKLIVSHYHPEARRLENLLHNRFTSLRLETSEWFTLGKEELDFLRQKTNEIIELYSFNFPDKSEGIEVPEVYPSTNQRLKSQIKGNSKKKNKEIKSEPKKIIEGVRIENGVPFNELYAEHSIEEEFHYGLLPQIEWLYEKRGTWQAVAEFYHVDPVVIWKIANWNWMPIFDNSLRDKLGLCTFLSPEGKSITEEQISEIILSKSR